jgi:hypothetical protein
VGRGDKKRRVAGRGTVVVFSSASVSGPGVEMFFSLFSTCAVGLAFVVIFLMIVVPFVFGFFDRREIP